ncbi:5'-methylthioadenosine phosphorylase [Ceratobasidium sp. AG-Ba]|nr:5'-methylthioadenosine phosphorylase [Ceratobasidium sp. AG-Ba]QRW08489.1 5'-methylthioadenosine phosphorylase [Ceratobasidium sp. AG-Ba]
MGRRAQIPASFAQAIEAIDARVPQSLREPAVGIVCGSGLGGLAEIIRGVIRVPYNEIPGFGISTVAGHSSELAFGRIGEGEGVPVVAMLGRVRRQQIRLFPIRVMALLGVKSVIITNAAGILNPKYPVGTGKIQLFDVILLAYTHPIPYSLCRARPPCATKPDILEAPFQLRFTPLSKAYTFSLRCAAFRAAHALKFPKDFLAEGTYAWVSGPTYETPAEGRFLRAAGVDVVGMSTVPEVVAAHQAGMDVLVLSLGTNAVVIPEGYRSAREAVDAEIAGKPLPPVVEAEVSHEEVLALGKAKSADMRRLVEKIVGSIGVTGQVVE